jgi:hypothetical protein
MNSDGTLTSVMVLLVGLWEGAVLGLVGLEVSGAFPEGAALGLEVNAEGTAEGDSEGLVVPFSVASSSEPIQPLATNANFCLVPEERE